MRLLRRLLGKKIDPLCKQGASPPAEPICPIGDKPFPIVLSGRPSLQLTLDREYGIIKTEGNGISYMFISPDRQSSAVLFIDCLLHNQTETSITERYEGAEVTKSAGIVNGKKVEWWRWKDSNQLYSRYKVLLIDREGTARAIAVTIIANSHDRSVPLEHAFSTIEFL